MHSHKFLTTLACFTGKFDFIPQYYILKYDHCYLICLISNTVYVYLQYLIAQNYSLWGVWIGGNDLDKEGIWKWVGSGDPVPYSGWYCGEPNNRKGNQNCMVISIGYKGRFDDTMCDGEFSYFCEDNLGYTSGT